MHTENLHIPDHDLLLMADGELSASRTQQVQTHLSACWNCRARLAEIESTIVDYARACRAPAAELPPVAGSRALLSAHLAQLASQSGTRSWRWLRSFPSALHVGALFAVITAALAGGLLLHYAAARHTNAETSLLELGIIPDGRLTPGEARTAKMDDLCSSVHEEVVGQVTDSLRKQVLKEYGIPNARAHDYEIDYLIAPRLGGTEYIHNLWPQPYSKRPWNAYAKDALEERLHQLVCRRELNLAVAQREIAANWIAAYKKYFATNQPLPE